jgi:methyl-accepting chemotaxis protein
MQLDNLKVSTRLGAGFSLVLLLTAGLMAVGLSHIAGTESGEGWTRAGAAATLGTWSQANARATLELSLAGDTAQAAAVRQQLASGEKAAADALAALGAGAPPAEEKALLARVRSAQSAHAQALGKINKQLDAGDREGAARAWAGDVRPTLELLQKELAALTELQARRAKAGSASAQRWMVGLGLAALLVGCTVAWRLGRSIAQPLNEAIYIAETVAAGDLSQEFATERGGDFGRLLGALGDMEDTLTDLVSRIKGSTDSITMASRDIAAGNADLSRRTEEQATSLEETVSSMEELTSTVRLNAEHARAASGLAANASGTAEQRRRGRGAGGADTMAAISGSSKKIVDIIGRDRRHRLPDQHPGAQRGGGSRARRRPGPRLCRRGQRSARPGAAQRRSRARDQGADRRLGGEVENGSELVGQAGRTMQDIVQAVKRVSSLLEQISAARSSRATASSK